MSLLNSNNLRTFVYIQVFLANNYNLDIYIYNYIYNYEPYRYNYL